MKLYYSPGACSLATHITLRETGADFTMERVDLKTKTTETGANYAEICDKGYIPALQLGSGDVLTEGAVIMQYLADQKPAAKLAPAPGTMERVHLNEWLAYISTEVHKGFSPLFQRVNEGAYDFAKKRLLTRLDYLNDKLAGREYLTGATFTIADAYLFTTLNWGRLHDIDLAKWPNLAAFHQRIAQRPTVQAAMEAEGLLKKAA